MRLETLQHDPRLITKSEEEWDAVRTTEKPEKLKELILLLQDFFSDPADDMTGAEVCLFRDFWKNCLCYSLTS